MNLTLLQWIHLTELEERRILSYYCSWEGRWRKGWRGGMGLEEIQTSPCPQHPPEAQEGGGLEQMCVEPVCLLCRACHPHGRLPLRGTFQPKSWDLATRSSATWRCRPQLQKTRSCQTSPAGGTGRMRSAAFLICGARLRAAVGR